MCVWIFYTNVSETFIVLTRTERDTINVYTGRHVMYLLFLSEFIETWISSEDFRKMLRLSKLTKIRPVGAEFFHAGGRMDGQKERQIW